MTSLSGEIMLKTEILKESSSHSIIRVIKSERIR